MPCAEPPPAFAVGPTVLAFMTMLPLLGLWSPEAGDFILCIEEVAITRRLAFALNAALLIYLA
jgi:hypothetical protein